MYEDPIYLEEIQMNQVSYLIFCVTILAIRITTLSELLIVFYEMYQLSRNV